MKKNKIAINGVLLLNKPVGISSHWAMQKTKYAISALKAGYIGTLDPLASGLLPICFGEATKFACFKNEADKRYRALIQLGIRTDSGDACGKIIASRDVMVTQEQILDALNNFIGNQTQIPPMYSALKYKGKCLYEYARQGINIDRLPRKVTIYSIKFFDEQVNINNTIGIDVHCSKGTYIRSLVDDVGEFLGCGAHLISLDRLSIGDWCVNDAVDLVSVLQQCSEKLPVFSKLVDIDSENEVIENLQSFCFQNFNTLHKNAWLSIDSLLSSLMIIVLDENQVKRLLQGQKLRLNCNEIFKNVEQFRIMPNWQIFQNKQFFISEKNICSASTIMAAYSIEGLLIGTVKWVNNLLEPLRMIKIS